VRAESGKAESVRTAPAVLARANGDRPVSWPFHPEVRVLRYLTAGESHGPALTVVVEGLPAGLPVTVEQIGDELARRRPRSPRGPRMLFPRDDLELLGGVRHGLTLGSPVAIVIHNTEWPKWQEEMSPAPGA